MQERPADRIPGEGRAGARQDAQRGLKGRPDALRPPGQQPVDAAWDGVALPDVDRDAGHARGEDDRERYEAPGRAADVWFEPDDLAERVDAGDRHEQPARDEREPRVRIAERRHDRRVERDGCRAHEVSLEPATTTEEEEGGVWIPLAERLRDREERADVTARPATDEEYATSLRARRMALDQHSGGYRRR